MLAPGSTARSAGTCRDGLRSCSLAAARPRRLSPEDRIPGHLVQTVQLAVDVDAPVSSLGGRARVRVSCRSTSEVFMKRYLVLGGCLVLGALSMTVVSAQQQPPKPAASAIKVMKLKDNLFVLNALAGGGGGNTSVLITEAGVVVVDTKNPGWGQPLLEVIKTLTPKPVTLIVNTHTHGDHVSGNVEFPATIDIVTHENTKTNMMAMRPAAFVAQPASGPPPNIFTQHNGVGMPKRTFKDSMTIGR